MNTRLDPSVRRQGPAVRVLKSRNTLARWRSWQMVIRFQSLSACRVLDRPSSGSRQAWHGGRDNGHCVNTMEALLSYGVSRDLHARLD